MTRAIYRNVQLWELQNPIIWQTEKRQHAGVDGGSSQTTGRWSILHALAIFAVLYQYFSTIKHDWLVTSSDVDDQKNSWHQF